MDIQIAGTIDDSIVDGDGIRYTVFVQGCSHHCKGCHNPETWNPQSGTISTTDKILEEYKKNPLLSGMTFSGGEPFEQPKPLIVLAEAVHKLGGDIWCYTGYTLEQLKTFKEKGWKELLDNIDYLVDGPFILEQRDLTLKFRGSQNQRIWDMKNQEIIS